MKLFLILLLAFVLIDILIVAYVLYRQTRRRLSPVIIREAQKHWKQIIRGSDERHAILEADKLLDYVLGHMGYRGNLGNKLKQSSGRFRNINKIWQAHKVRNNIAHQINYKVDEKTYRATMLIFKEAFKDLKIF